MPARRAGRHDWSAMSIRNDYILDMIVQFTQSIVEAMVKSRGGAQQDAVAMYEEVVGRALDMDAQTVLTLTPESLVTLVRLSAVDESLAVYAVYSLMRAAEIYDAEGDATGSLRAQQARAIADVYGFPVTEVPEEVVRKMEEAGL